MLHRITKRLGTKPEKAGARAAAKAYYLHWRAFINHPIFLSSLSISLLYFTTLSFECVLEVHPYQLLNALRSGIFVSWLKTHAWSNAFIAGMRAVTVLTARPLFSALEGAMTFLQGLAGTVVFPFLEKRLGLVRAGSWSICERGPQLSIWT
jgi:iron-regulated transporter 1